MKLKKAYYGNYHKVMQKRLMVFALAFITLAILGSLATAFIFTFKNKQIFNQQI